MANPPSAPPPSAMPPGTLPYSPEAEEAAIGAVLINPALLHSLQAILRPDDFFYARNQFIWQALERLLARNERIDFLTLTEELRDHEQLEDVGGEAHIVRLFRATPSSAHAEAYARIVERASTRRRLLVAADEIKELALDESKPLEEVTSEAESKLFNITEGREQRDMVPLRKAISEYYDRIEYLHDHPNETLGLPSGFRDLDRLLGGCQKSDLLICAGRPGMGKTSFLLSVALNAARFGGRVVIFTMEMGREQITQRFVSMETSINMQRLRQGQLNDQEYARFVEASGRISELPIYIDDSPGINPIQLRTRARRAYYEHGIDLVIIDYLQLMNAGNVYENNRVQEISYISRSIKELARELDVPVLSAAQLSRAVEQRHNKRPLLSDLRESGSIEQDADAVMFLYRDVIYNEATEFPNQAEVILAKHRNGPTGRCTLFFEQSITRFMDARTMNISLEEPAAAYDDA